MSVRDRLIRALADGSWQSGGVLAAGLGVTRSAVWKQVRGLRALGLQVEAAGRRGYRLGRTLDLLDVGLIAANLAEDVRAACEGLEVACVTTSTSAMVSAAPAPAAGRWRAALAEYQTSGRGRRGRRWLSPFGSGLCLSLGLSYASVPRDLPALSLAAGLAVVRALESIGARGLALKWPNDILVDGNKAGGLLVDVEGDSRGPLRAIIGVGLNFSTSSELVSTVIAEGGVRPGSLADVLPGPLPDRNALAAALLCSLYRVARDFGQAGFAPLAEEWRRHDYLEGRELLVQDGSGQFGGVGCGLGADGALLLRRADATVALVSGEVTVRPSS
jgi:BirA family biotin operon repressor/biotin-[acetyl-CoA-carboxylase] ligase